MINQQLLAPRSIVVVGASNDITKPGGKVLKNLIDSNFSGKLYVANPKEDTVQGVSSFRDLKQLPQTDLAILAIAAKFCPDTVELLAKEKETRAFIILSAGFGEESHEGALLEQRIVDTINSVNGCLIGPNCIGVLNTHYAGVFTTPIPGLSAQGVDFISGSGATAVFIMEAGIPKGLKFASVYSVGNSAQTGVEDILKFMDETYTHGESSPIKVLYLESIKKPEMLLKHAASLIRKGCRIAAVKAGSSSAGSRAASSHTGALASPDSAVDALFRKAGIVRCYGREDLISVISIFQHPELKGKNIAIITHAGGPAVMLTDALSNNGLEVPHITNPEASELLNQLFPGSSVANPIDFLATGTAAQLGAIIDYCDKKFDEIDGMAVIFGSPGLFNVYDVYNLLDEKMKTCRKPIYPILPSVINVKDEIADFLRKDRVFFPDEVIFGQALARVFHTPKPQPETVPLPEDFDLAAIRKIIDAAEDGYLLPDKVHNLLKFSGIQLPKERVVRSKEDAYLSATEIGFPLVMKVVGPVHKSDVGGVVLNVNDLQTVVAQFDRLMQIKDAEAVLLAEMLKGTEVFIGAKRESNFGHLLLCGLGGIFIEALKDTSASLAPVSAMEAAEMIKSLKSYKIIKGIRGQEPVNEEKFADAIVRIGALVKVAPEISEMDLNPLLGNRTGLTAVDARIRIERA
jgi:acetate---CoA ligase (ADP-forming)